MLTIDFVSDLMTRGALEYHATSSPRPSPHGQEALTLPPLGPSPVPTLGWSPVPGARDLSALPAALLLDTISLWIYI